MKDKENPELWKESMLSIFKEHPEVSEQFIKFIQMKGGYKNGE